MIAQYSRSVELMDPLISQGLTLMLYGMTTVVLFLLLLVLAMRVLAWFVSLSPTQAAKPVSNSTLASGASPNEETVAAIAAAVKRYRDRT